MVYGYTCAAAQSTASACLRILMEAGIAAPCIFSESGSQDIDQDRGFWNLLRCMRYGDVLCVPYFGSLGGSWDEVSRKAALVRKKDVELVVLNCLESGDRSIRRIVDGFRFLETAMGAKYPRKKKRTGHGRSFNSQCAAQQPKQFSRDGLLVYRQWQTGRIGTGLAAEKCGMHTKTFLMAARRLQCGKPRQCAAS